MIERDVAAKTFGTTHALDHLDLTVEQGEVHGFLGPNAAGKSTTIRVLLGLLRADSGTATMLGGDPWREAATLHRRLAYVPGDVSPWPNLSGGEVIDVLARMRGGLEETRRAEMLERFDLDPTEMARTYSKGNPQEVALVGAFLGYIYLFMAVIACGFVVSSVLRLRAEEESGRTEVVLATPVSRTSWMAATTAVELIAAAKLTVLMGLGLAVGYGVGSGEWDRVLPQVGGQLAYLPRTLVALQVILGQLLGLPDAVQAISPFWHLAAVPVDDFEVVPYAVLLLLAAVLVAAGLWGYRRRDAVAG